MSVFRRISARIHYGPRSYDLHGLPRRFDTIAGVDSLDLADLALEAGRCGGGFVREFEARHEPRQVYDLPTGPLVIPERIVAYANGYTLVWERDLDAERREQRAWQSHPNNPRNMDTLEIRAEAARLAGEGAGMAPTAGTRAARRLESLRDELQRRADERDAAIIRAGQDSFDALEDERRREAWDGENEMESIYRAQDQRHADSYGPRD